MTRPFQGAEEAGQWPCASNGHVGTAAPSRALVCQPPVSAQAAQRLTVLPRKNSEVSWEQPASTQKAFVVGSPESNWRENPAHGRGPSGPAHTTGSPVHQGLARPLFWASDSRDLLFPNVSTQSTMARSVSLEHPAAFRPVFYPSFCLFTAWFKCPRNISVLSLQLPF